MNERERTRAKILGVLIRDARLYAARSEADCARALNIELDQFSQYEQGEGQISLPELEALAVYLGVSLSHFMGNKTFSNYPLTRYGDFIIDRAEKIREEVIAMRSTAGRSIAELATATGIDAEKLTGFEAGSLVPSYFQLERIAQALNGSVSDFNDPDHPLLTEHEQTQKQRDRFEQMPDEMKAFVTEPINESYLEIALRLSKMDVNSLRTVAENILNITF